MQQHGQEVRTDILGRSCVKPLVIVMSVLRRPDLQDAYHINGVGSIIQVSSYFSKLNR